MFRDSALRLPRRACAPDRKMGYLRREWAQGKIAMRLRQRTPSIAFPALWDPIRVKPQGFFPGSQDLSPTFRPRTVPRAPGVRAEPTLLTVGVRSLGRCEQRSDRSSLVLTRLQVVKGGNRLQPVPGFQCLQRVRVAMGCSLARRLSPSEGSFRVCCKARGSWAPETSGAGAGAGWRVRVKT